MRVWIGLLSLLLTAAPLRAATVYGVYSFFDENTETDQFGLLRFDSSNPSSTVVIGPLAGNDEPIYGIDFNPADGKLYGLTPSRLITIDTATGATMTAATLTVQFNGTRFGMDFSPVTGLLHVTSDTGQHLIIDPSDGSSSPLPSSGSDLPALGYGDGGLFGLVYDPNGVNTALARINPTTGAVTNIANLSIQPRSGDGELSLDILTDQGGDIAFAFFNRGDDFGQFFTLNLTDGTAELVGSGYVKIPDSDTFGLIDFAVQPTPVPEPAAAGLALAGLACAGLLLRRRWPKAMPTAS
jgi:hypothetical protein